MAYARVWDDIFTCAELAQIIVRGCVEGREEHRSMEDGIGYCSKAGLRDWVDSLGSGPCVTRKRARGTYLSEIGAGTKSLRSKTRTVITP